MRSAIRTTVAISTILYFAGMAIAVEQPHMEEALHHLEQAKHEIEIADQAKDHGGHAGAATGLIEQAIREVREGIRFRNEHGK